MVRRARRCPRLTLRGRPRPVRTRRDRLHQRHHRLPQGRGAQPVQPAGARRRAGRQPGLRSCAAQGRLPAAHHPEHARAHHPAHRAGGRVRGDLRPQRRGRRRRVDPRRAGDHVERPTRARPLARRRRRGRARRSRDAPRGVDRRGRLSRADPGRVRGQVRQAGARDLRPQRGADGGDDRRARREPRGRRERPSAPAPRDPRRRRRDLHRTADRRRVGGRVPADARLLAARRRHRRDAAATGCCTPATSASSTTTGSCTSATARAC